QGVRVALQDLVADGGEAFAEDLTHIRVGAGAADDLGHRVRVDVADRELVQVGGEAAAGLDLSFGVDDQRLTRSLAIVLLEPVAVPGAREALSSLNRSQVVPVERHGQVRAYQ